jgi:hypothetical protein
LNFCVNSATELGLRENATLRANIQPPDRRMR